jgi:uncharacterized damage-inducible protein DinB
MREYLETMTDEAIDQHPWAEGEDKDLLLWEVLFHVANHGTDHRAQILRAVRDLGLETPPQDYAYYAYQHPAA